MILAKKQSVQITNPKKMSQDLPPETFLTNLNNKHATIFTNDTAPNFKTSHYIEDYPEIMKEK